MSFHVSAENTRVDEGHLLRATLRKADGNFADAELDLNQVIGNSYGQFEWGGINFSGSAQNINFGFEGDQQMPILRAELQDNEGNWIARDIDLAERIGNNDGQFLFE